MKRSLSILALATITLLSCASSVKKFDYPPTTSGVAEIDRLENEMSSAVYRQVNVLSPGHFADARKKLDEAKKESQDRVSNAEILESLGYARAHLDAANEVAPRVEAAMPEVTKARSDAISAEAVRLRNADLIDADNRLKSTSKQFESGTPTVSVEKRGELQKKYLDVELAAIKTNYLDQPKALIDTAKKLGAKRAASNTLASAEAKYQAAGRVIETDRHNLPAITRATEAATAEAKRAVEITRISRGVRETSPEETAIELEAKRNEAARNAAEAERNAMEASQNSENLRTARQTIQDKNSEIAASEEANAKLSREKRFNEAFENAQKKFSADEAEVYRQGDNLVVRLKSVQFPSGSAELPETSIDVLDKVKDVISTLGADKVIVEGHTDAVGPKAENMKLSEKRAEIVADYFVSENALPADKIESKGFGDTRPLVSNKSKTGRAQNRRVDVVISATKPESVGTSASSAVRKSDLHPGENTSPEKPAAPPWHLAPSQPPLEE